MRSRAILNVSVTSLFAALLKPMWLSLICRKLRSVAVGKDDPVFATSARVFETRTPPLMVQSTPVPAHAMHFRKPRRSIPSGSSLCRMSLLLFMICLSDRDDYETGAVIPDRDKILAAGIKFRLSQSC